METIRSQMTTPVISIYSEATAQEAAQLMVEKEIGSLLVKGCQGYVGILAERDLVHRIVSEGLDPKTTPLSSIMEESILSIDLNATTCEAGTLMKEYNLSHLTVTDNEEITGILSLRDLVHKNKVPA
ncbi:MAG: CBS domain-containing protein [Nitrospina sp.]|jgi:signal-transduction protein with cAMP-binding, CBS, and nucleotidyltransferase domain|nr:CBS domain-containing protein [Nitrospina sp.]MBT3510116.1 CBS domain-containing protein [Nitrospina sp.]MBT3877361.1 CBS domain-containing protein [Nitrospina sp.]MBT4046768.1 CBS domain-containing protein [Nitrospina sp.]MBT4557510.1 CBS domain-containing protein [Nitrospina sp.]